MASDVYKQKYLEIRSKWMESLDMAFRDGFEQGTEKAQMQAMQQQMEMQQQQMAAQQQAMMGGQPGEEGDPNAQGEQVEGGEEEDPMAQLSPEEQQIMAEQVQPGGAAPGMEMQGGEQPGELDSKIQELQNMLSKGEKPKVLDLRKLVNELTSVRKSQIEEFKNKNKKVESAQRSVVKSIIKKWSEESKSVSQDLEKIIATEGLKLD